MARAIRARIEDERGFTLMELLVVLLVLGILAAIAYSQFFGHKDRSEDAVAKSVARVLVTHVEACFAREEDYQACASADDLAPLEIEWGTGAGQASVTEAGERSYTIQGVSPSQMGGETHLFFISKDTDTGVITQSCTPVGFGGCPETGLW